MASLTGSSTGEATEIFRRCHPEGPRAQRGGPRDLGTIVRRVAATLLLALSPTVAIAQNSPYLPLDDIAYAYIDALRARGELRTLSMLERPYTVQDVRHALAERTGTADSPVLESWRTALREAMTKYDPWADRCAESCSPDSAQDLAIRASAGVFASARSSGIRELMLADDEDGVYPGAIGRFVAKGGPFVASTRVVMDNRLKDDPEYVGKKDRAIAGRVEDAYLGVDLPWVQLTAGRVARNLGPAPLHGLQIGHYAYSWDHLFLRLGTPRFHLSTIVAALDPLRLGPDSLAQRYLALHRLSGRWGGLEIAIAEGMLFGGVDRRFDPGFLNPLNVYQLTQYNERGLGNVSLSIEAAWRSERAGTFAAQLLMDDFQVDDCEPNCQEPTSYGLGVSAEGLPLWGTQRWFASYARVANLTYRTPAPYESWTSFGVGLGHGFSDYDEARIGLDLAFVPRVALRPYGAVRRQGEGDYRLPYPAAEDYATTPAFHAGVVQRTVRLGATASWMPARGIEVRGDLGWNRATDAGHVEGATASEIEGWIRVALESPWVLQRRLSRD